MRSKRFQTGSQQSPKIRTGGSSDSNTLNRYFESVTFDILSMAADIDLLESRVTDLNSFGQLQLDALNSVFNSIETRIQVMSSGSHIEDVFVDMAGSYNIDLGTTALRDQRVSQATLPILSSTDLLKFSDVYGNMYIPEDIKLKYGFSNDSSLPEFYMSSKSNAALLGTRPWLLSWPTGYTANETTLYFKLECPIKYEGLAPNVLEFTLLPSFLGQLSVLGYHSSLSPLSADLTPIDYSYITGYNTALYGNSNINQVSKVKVYLPKEDIGSIVIGFTLPAEGVWGIADVSLKHIQFEETADLIVTNPFGDIDSVYLKGKDENTLSDLPISINSNTATISLSTFDPFFSPIVTGVVISTSN